MLARVAGGVEPHPLDPRVARRVHQSRHALFWRPCGRCGLPFEYCGSCQPGRTYCGEVCSEAARAESTRRARGKYNDRDSDEGREAHRAEEADRRERRARARVGDHRLQEQAGGLELIPSAAFQAAAESNDAALVSPVSQPVLEVLDHCAPCAEPRAERPHPVPVEWVLVAWPGLLQAALRRVGTDATCPFCGRCGRITRVVSLDRWRRCVRRGFG
jgi:hypothetical protein